MDVSVIIALVVLMCVNVNANSSTYRAAVVEFQPVDYTGNDQETMFLNARLIANYAKQAGQQNVDIIAFPEYGITTLDGGSVTRKRLVNQTQDVPDPKAVEWNPCLESNRFPKERNKILREISCSARNNSVAILVNLMSRESCSSSDDPNCPKDGSYFYNTNIIFNKNGTLLYRYHKNHLFAEGLLNAPVKPEYPVLDLGFAKIASFTCFDIFYKEPAIVLVEKHNVRNLIFSTAWINELPFYTAPQLMAQFAHGMGANILATNMHYPEITRMGSGIYSSHNGALNESWDLATPGYMVVADVPVNPPTATEEWTTCNGSSLATEVPQVKPKSCVAPILDWNSNIQSINAHVPSSKPITNRTHKIYYEPLVNYTYVNLTGQKGSVDVCQGKFCCNATYEFDIRGDNDTYVLAVRNGCRFFFTYNIGLQVCAILQCKTPGDIQSCGRVPEEQPASRFKRILISGVFQTPYIYPNILSTTLHNVPRDQYQFRKKSCKERISTAAKATATLETRSALTEHPVLVVSLYGRMYDWD